MESQFPKAEKKHDASVTGLDEPEESWSTALVKPLETHLEEVIADLELHRHIDSATWEKRIGLVDDRPPGNTIFPATIHHRLTASFCKSQMRHYVP